MFALWAFVALVVIYVLAYRYDKNSYMAFAYVVSSIHAGIVGVWGLYLLITHETLRRECIISRDADEWLLMQVMFVYLLADLVCVAIWYSKREIVIHHLIGVFGLGLGYYNCIGFGFCARFAITELSTLPLNLCWYLRKKKDTPKYVLGIAGIVLIVMYFLTRVAIIPDIVLTCYPQMLSQLPLSIATIGVVIVTYTAVMNVVWFYRIVRQFVDVVLAGNVVEKHGKTV